jgi:hypothetical protein
MRHGHETGRPHALNKYRTNWAGDENAFTISSLAATPQIVNLADLAAFGYTRGQFRSPNW